VNCPECGIELKGEPAFCDACGAELKKEKATGEPTPGTVVRSGSDAEGATPGTVMIPKKDKSHPPSFGRYRVLREVGRGAMGVVYLARDEKIGRNVAIKALDIDRRLPEDQKEEIRNRFEREARAAGMLSQENIVTVYDVGEEDGIPYIAMEYLEGATLTEVAHDSPLSIPQAKSVIAQVLSALSYAHSHDVVHRDIKPDNISLLPDGRVKVADFGIARIASSSTMTQVGQVMGTPGYMSPEQVKGEVVGPPSDIFSTGVLLYELLTGAAPFSSTSATSIMYKIVHEEPRPPHLINPGVPPNLEAVIARATAKNPAARYGSASEMRQDIESGATPETASMPSAEGTMLRGAPLEQAMPPAAMAPSPSLAAQPEKKKHTGLWVGIGAGALLLVAAVVVVVVLVIVPMLKFSLSIKSPTARAKVSNPMHVAISVSDPSKVDRVELYVDGTEQKSLTASPYEADLDPGPAGERELRASAYNQTGAVLADVTTKYQSEGGGKASPATNPPASSTAPTGGDNGENKSPEPAQSTTNYFAGTPLTTYTNSAWRFSISCPAGWTKEENTVSYGYRVRWWSPDRQLYFLVDSSTPDADVSTTARDLNGKRQGQPGYTLDQITVNTFHGHPACIYEFSANSIEDDFFKGMQVKKYDYFVNGPVHGYAVLLGARPGTFNVNLQSWLDRIVETFQPDI
jgi:tRNA A-37 threonylcarbamoyl transferase component Bud32